MISKMRNRGLALVVTIWMTLFLVSPATAALIPSQGSSQAMTDIDTIQRALENKLVQEKLQAYGLSAAEVNAKLAHMTPAQLHLIAQASNDVLAGGDDGLGLVIGVLVVIILVIIILKLLGKDIIIKFADLDRSLGSEPVALS